MRTLSDLTKSVLIPTNSSLDDILGGGIEKGCITQIYGPPGCGKTNIALTVLYESTKNNSKAIYMDTEGGLSLERIQQIAGSDFDSIANNIYLFEPKSFNEQQLDIQNIEKLLQEEKNIDVLIIDSIVALYRVEEGDPSDINKKLGRTMAKILTLSREYNIAVLITNQIYSPFDEDDLIVEPIGGTVLKYWSKIIVEIERIPGSTKRSAILQRHKTKAPGISVTFSITDEGIT
ncbi:DNA repair and recombination protein RadB [Methanosphaera sp. WGK6]|uniref:DNA repair and recombination protein RadB n=1 Tax=Methanosphaera sp. WGK6 TaxID=1561964 RepID=UPI00084CE206|nr:DNA repair and recombination protein RadB [Methanosphaera sp. WGK6]OED30083.1 DNA repair protein RadB [Methanosphaera sp. WGK6]